MKRILAFCIILSALFCFVGVALAEDDCPYDDDYKYALQKALVDYLKDPQASKFSLGEVKDMLGFYLKEDSITNANCTQEIKALVEKADKVEDGLMFKMGGRDANKCDVCPDGTLCVRDVSRLERSRHRLSSEAASTATCGEPGYPATFPFFRSLIPVPTGGFHGPSTQSHRHVYVSVLPIS